MEKDRSNKNNLFQKIRDPNLPVKKYTIFKMGAAAILLGMGLIIFSPDGDPIQRTNSTVTTSSNVGQESIEASAESKVPGTIGTMEKEFEQQLKDLLEETVGVSEVSVMVNLDATSTKIFEKNVNTQIQQTTESDKQGGTRSIDQQNTNEQVVIVRNGSEEQPVLQKEQKPTVRGVLIVAKGADKIDVKKNIIEAVTRALDVPSHRVSVQAKK